MNKLQVPFCYDIFFNDPHERISAIFLNHPSIFIDFDPWSLPGVKPEVSFKIAYGADGIFLKFDVKEEHFKATYKNINDPVYKDSCVEFFIGLDDSDNYYNFEFNALGTAYVAYGSPQKRDLLDKTLIKEIKFTAEYKKIAGNTLLFGWELTLAIPFSLFSYHSISSLEGMVCRANFYKCGDDLPQPHFLCWNNIIADKPDFHLPQYFGQLIFG